MTADRLKGEPDMVCFNCDNCGVIAWLTRLLFREVSGHSREAYIYFAVDGDIVILKTYWLCLQFLFAD